MENPPVKVTDITDKLGGNLPLDRQIKLGDAKLDQIVNTLLNPIKKAIKGAYLLEWEGGKIPRGAVVGDKTLAWTQNGFAHGEDGRMVGTYDRIVEFGGANKQKQIMVVYLD